MTFLISLRASWLLATLASIAAHSSPPTAESLRVSWPASPVRAMPVVQNFVGGATLRGDGGFAFAPGGMPGVGIAALGPVTLTPFRGNFFNASMRFNGLNLYVNTTEWSPCEGIRRSIGEKITVVNKVRLPFEDFGVMQQWEVAAHASIPQVSIDALLDGPFFRQCGDDGHACGWGTSLPTDRENFSRRLLNMGGVTVMVITDGLTNASAASAFWCVGTASCGPISVELAPTLKNSGGFVVKVSGKESQLTVRHATAVALNEGDAVKKLRDSLLGDDRFESMFRRSCLDWEARWSLAFNDGLEHFSGSLPVLKSNSGDLDRLYYWAALALVSLERTNLKSFPRQFVISEGPSNSLRGDADMGGSGQFVWDLSFSAASLALLEPKGTRHVLQYIIENSDWASDPIGLPQSWDAYPSDFPVQPGVYCFDFIATFMLFQQYVVTTGDGSMLSQAFVSRRNSSMSISGVDFLRKIAWHWTAYERSVESPYLVDYGNNKRFFLEAVPTYYGVVPALQLSNAGMLFSLARLLAVSPIHGSAEEISSLRGNASAIVRDALRFQYVKGTGYWQCLHLNGSAPTEVRALADLIYVGLSVGLLGREPQLLPEGVRQGVLGFFARELQADGWLQAFSLSDPAMAETLSEHPSILGKLAMRADWTATGAYGGLPGLAIDALADYEQGLGASLESLRNLSLAAKVSMPAQGIAVLTPPYIAAFLDNNRGLPLPDSPFAPLFPEFFDTAVDPEFDAWWPSSLRSIQNAVAAINDAFVRSVFGWRPDWDVVAPHHSADAAAMINAALFLPTQPRPGFEGTLYGLRTPYGLIDITASEGGLFWNFHGAEILTV